MSDTIFIVDDDDGHAELIEENLRDGGIMNDVRRFENGYDVLDAIFDPNSDKELPILILLDLNMPGMRGTDVLKQLRAHENTKSVPVVILTTSSSSPEIKECYELGCNLYLAKPVLYEEFVQVIKLLGVVLNIIELPSNEVVATGH